MDALILCLVSQRVDAALGRAADDALAKIAALLPPALEDAAVITGLRNWGQPLRFGLLSISCGDFRLITAAMNVEQKAPATA